MVALTDGEILIFEVVDVADEIDLSAAERLIGRQPEGNSAPHRLRLSPEREAVVVADPPLVVELGDRAVPTPGGERHFSARASLFAFGAVAVRYALALAPGSSLEAIGALVVELSRPATRAALSSFMAKDAAALATRLNDALR